MAGDDYSPNLRAHKVFNVFFIIILIPTLILAFLSALTMLNGKRAGGYPNLFGFYVIQLKDDNYKNADGNYSSGSNQLFKSPNLDNLKPGVLIAYYSEENDDPDAREVVGNLEWLPLSANNIHITTSSYGTDTSDEQSSIKFAYLGHQVAVATIEGKKYKCYTYYNSYADFTNNTNPQGNDQGETLLIETDMLGVAIPNNFLTSVLLFFNSMDSFVFVIVAPCILLVILKIISLSFYKKFTKEKQTVRKGSIVSGDTKQSSTPSYGYNRPIPARTNTRTLNGSISTAVSKTSRVPPKPTPPPPPPPRPRSN